MKKNNKVIIIMPQLSFGGAEKQFNYLRKGLEEKGWEVITVLSTIDYFDEQNKIFGIKIKENFIVHELKLIAMLVRLRYQYNVNHVIVYDVYGHYLIGFLKIIGFYVIFCERNSGEHRHYIARVLISMADVVTVNSKEAEKKIKAYVDNEKVHYISNGIELPKYEYKDEYVKDIFKILIPARIAPVKNQLFAIEAIKDLNNVELHMAGKVTDENYFRKINLYLDNNNLVKKVYYDGFIEEMDEYYQKFDLILLPSLSEGTPNVILEGYARCKLCLMSDIPMNRDIAITAEMIFDYNEQGSLADKILEMIQLDSNKKLKLVTDEYNFVATHYSLDSMICNYERLLAGGLESENK